MEETKFSSGAKSSGALPPYSLLTKTLLSRSAARMRLGLHYGRFNWLKGAKDKEFILDRLNHAMEHLMNAMHEIEFDKGYKDDDLSAVVVNCMFAMEYQEQVLKKPIPESEEYVAISNKIPIKDNEKAMISIIDAVPLLDAEDIKSLIDYLVRFRSDLKMPQNRELKG